MKTNIGPFLLVLLLIVGCQPSDQKQNTNSEELPNIIMLVGDDQGYPYFGFMGADYVHTPNMDKLAASGTLFTDGYVSDNHCRPSLQTLLTGLLPIDYTRFSDSIYQGMIAGQELTKDSLKKFHQYFDTRAIAFSQARTLPRMLAEKGYVSFQGGKWWEFTYENGGFTHGMTKGFTMEDQKSGNWFEKHMGGDGMELSRVSNQAAYDFLEETKGKPFFMWFAPSLPHYPFDAPKKYYDLYADKEMSESAKLYYANCTWFDEAWGEMVEHLKEKGVYDNTLIVYVNDNGWEQEPLQEFVNDPMRSHNGGDKGKSSIYDMSFRSPIIFSWKGKIAAGGITDALMHSADIPATILDYVGLDIPENFYGQSYRPVLEGKEDKLRDLIQGNVISTRSKDPKNVMGDHVQGYWVREGKWFLRWHETYGEMELFDVENDPRNDHNVADQHPEVFQRLLARAKAYRDAKGVDARYLYYTSLKE
ncbi:MAG: sulfatase-like hydrolase/transferase [Bacteroidota bacterium]